MSLKLCELLEIGCGAGNSARSAIYPLSVSPRSAVGDESDRNSNSLFLPQFDYKKPYLAVDPFYEHETTSKKLQTIAAVFRSHHPETDRLVNNVLASSDFHTSFLILSTVRSWLGADRLNQIFNIDTSKQV